MSKLLIFLFVTLSVANSFANQLLNPMLWSAKKDNQTIYLLGTFHLGVSADQLPQKVFELIDSSKTIIFEADISLVDQSKIISEATFKNGQSLDQFLPPQSWRKLVTIFKDSLPEEELKKFKPWFISNLMTSIITQQLQLKGSMDMELVQYVEQGKQKISFLETPDLQFSVLEAVSSTYLLDEVLNSSANPMISMENEFVILLDCFIEADTQCIYSRTTPNSQNDKIKNWQYELLFKQRNRTWVPMIEEAATQGKVFVAVGAGHLVGETTVLDLLENRGFKIERVDLN